jgi:hypothetical protein
LGRDLGILIAKISKSDQEMESGIFLGQTRNQMEITAM